MKPLLRWYKFNVVGAMGMGVQFTTLALWMHYKGGHSLLASSAAIELTLVHNFLWHWHYTWRDRRQQIAQFSCFLRFQLSSGLVSLLGNLFVMRLFLARWHLPLLVATLISITGSSILNYLLSNRCVFSDLPKQERTKPSSNSSQGVTLMRATSTCILLSFVLIFKTAHAQTQTSPSDLPDTPAHVPAATYHPSPSDTYLYHVGAFCGLGASTSQAATLPTTGCGAGLTLVPVPLFIEVGIMGPQATHSNVSGYLSLDTSIPLARQTRKYLPLVLVGYSRLFEVGHALDYGLVLALPRPGKKKEDTSNSLRIELRDYWTFANPDQHNVMLRIGWMGEEAD